MNLSKKSLHHFSPVGFDKYIHYKLVVKIVVRNPVNVQSDHNPFSHA
jgi:hypothetical protein